MQNIKDVIALKVVEYYANYPQLMRDDILHTQEVVSYTRLIASRENLSERQVDLLEASAWLHDIGCPKSKEIYGNSLPPNQQKVGRDLARDLLKNIEGLSQEEKAWLVDVVGTHHQANSAKELQFLPLFEGDLIANILSGYFARAKAQKLYNTYVKTESGKTIFKTIFAELR